MAEKKSTKQETKEKKGERSMTPEVVEFLRNLESFVMSEKGMGAIELDNKLTLITHKQVHKHDVKEFFHAYFPQFKVKKVNSMIDTAGKKRHIVSFTEGDAAATVASELGLM